MSLKKNMNLVTIKTLSLQYVDKIWSRWVLHIRCKHNSNHNSYPGLNDGSSKIVKTKKQLKFSSLLKIIGEVLTYKQIHPLILHKCETLGRWPDSPGSEISLVERNRLKETTKTVSNASHNITTSFCLVKFYKKRAIQMMHPYETHIRGSYIRTFTLIEVKMNACATDPQFKPITRKTIHLSRTKST